MNINYIDIEKRFIIAFPEKVSLITEEELHTLMSLNSVSNMVIIDRNNLEKLLEKFFLHI